MKIIGIDEVNYSPSIAGDCIVVACHLLTNPQPGLLKDSKITSLKQRLKAFKWLQINSLYIVEIAAVNHLSHLGIYGARNQAIWRAINGLVNIMPGDPKDIRVLIDGLESWRPAIEKQGRRLHSIDFELIKGGDEIIPAISAASIIAKVYADALFEGWAKYWPKFNMMASDHGSCGKKHIKMLRKYGPTPIHRTKGYAKRWWKQIQNENYVIFKK